MSEPSTILVVDDQKDTGSLLARILKYLGHDAVHVPSGAAALKFMRDTPPDAVLLDYMMPDMDGLEVLRRMRNDPRTQGLPVIMFSASNDPNVIESAMKQGASDYWVKATVAMDDMKTRLERCLMQN
jgi:CheY-like chemotaxis protein